MRGVGVGAKREENQWVSFDSSRGENVLNADETITFIVSF